MPRNLARLQAFLARAYYDLGAMQSGALVALGDQLGLYKALDGAGPIAPDELARRTGLDARYVREWLVNQWAGGYVEHDAASGTFTLPDEHADVLAREDGAYFLGGAFRSADALARARPQVADAFRSGGGVPAEAYEPDFQAGLERTARARHGAHLVGWVEAMDGISARLADGGAVADVGCGGAAALVVLAHAYPRARLDGFDVHPAALERARAAIAGLEDRVRLGAAFGEGGPYDLVLCLDALHEMADPVAMARTVAASLAPGGAWLIAEPPAGGDEAGSVARFLSSLSALHCIPVARAAGGDGLGALAGEAALRGILAQAGFGHVRRLADSQAALVLDARR